MECEESANLISARLDDEIEPDDWARLEAHLASCAACRAAEAAGRAQHDELTASFATRRRASFEVADHVIREIRRDARPRLRWVPLIASAAAGFALAVLLFRPWDRSGDGGSPARSNPVVAVQSTPVGQLSLATGVVELWNETSSAWQPMTTGGRICAADRVRTGPAVRCEFTTPDGSTVRLNAGTEIGFTAARKLDVARGQLWSTVAKAPEPFQVVGAQTTVTALGTEFDFSCEGSQATLTVVEGSTRVRGPAGGESLVRSGQRVKVVDGRLTEPESVGDLVVATRWVHELLVMKGRDDPELARRVDDLFAQIGQTKMASLYEEEIRALGDHCVLPLTRYIESDRSRGDDGKRRTAARLLSDAAQPWSVPLLIELLADRDGEVRFHAARALERMTGNTFSCPPSQWRTDPPTGGAAAREAWVQWWEENKDRVPGASL